MGRRSLPVPLFRFRLFVILLAFCLLGLLAGCGTAEPAWQVYRLDDHLESAEISAVTAPSASLEAEPLRWDFERQEITWRPVRGRMGFKATGELIVQGEGVYPVITSPEQPEIDWARYESIAVRMLHTGGQKIKIKFEHQEYEQELGPPDQFRVYRFSLDINTPEFTGRLDILPTDSRNKPAAIDYIELIPRRTTFPDAAGKRFVGKQSDFRKVIYAHSPATLRYRVRVPKNANLQFGLGVDGAGAAVRFSVRNGDGGEVLFAEEWADPGSWRDVRVDLSSYAGDVMDLVLAAESSAEGRVVFWAHPLITAAAAKARPNVLLYVIDTLRADHTSLYGYPRPTTPFLEKLGAAGVVFEDCHAQATWTKPSVASLLTSLYSVTHGIRELTDTIPAGAATLAETLRGEGYLTASIVANPFPGRNTGLERGVDQLIEYPYLSRYRKESDGATDSGAVNQAAFPWLETHRDAPFFLYLHSTDPHAPYRPPADMEAKFADPSRTKRFNRDYEKLRQGEQRHGGGAVFQRSSARAKGVDPEQWIAEARNRYDAEIAHNDRSIGALLEKLEQLGILDNTLVVVVSDHGEEFLEHGWTTHGHSLYQEQTHTVLLFHHLRLLPAPLRIDEPAQLVDVMPTILDLLDIPVAGIVQGQSLVPLMLAEGMRAQPFERKLAVMSSRLAETNVPAAGGIPESRTETYLRLDAGSKLIYRVGAGEAGIPTVEYYDRAKDPADTTNLASEHAEEVARLVDEVKEWIAAQAEVRRIVGAGGKSTMDAATLERLRSLGYIGGGEQ